MSGKISQRLMTLSPAGTGPTGAALTTTIRSTFAACIAPRMERVLREATGSSLRPRGPTAKSTASLPWIAACSVSDSCRPATLSTVRAGSLIGSRFGTRTTAVTPVSTRECLCYKLFADPAGRAVNSDVHLIRAFLPIHDFSTWFPKSC
jgi:hypothetical protein